MPGSKGKKRGRRNRKMGQLLAMQPYHPNLWSEVYRKMRKSPNNNGAGTRIWIDLDNSPHVPLFRPIIERLKQQDYELLVTARDAYQVRDLVDFYGIQATIVGKHYGKHKLFKALGTFWRAFSLIQLVRKQRPDLAVCH